MKAAQATLRWLKYLTIIMKANLTRKTVVEFCGNTYIVYGNVVQLVGKNIK